MLKFAILVLLATSSVHGKRCGKHGKCNKDKNKPVCSETEITCPSSTGGSECHPAVSLILLEFKSLFESLQVAQP